MSDLDILYSCRKKYLILQGIVLLISFIALYLNDFRGSSTLFLILCLWNLFSYIHVFYYEIKYSPQFHPFIILALVTAQYIGLNGLGMYLELKTGKPIIFVVTDISDMLSGGVWFLMLQHYLTFAGYYYIFRKKFKIDSPTLIEEIENTPVNYSNWALKNYAFVWFLRVVNLFFNLASISSALASYAKEGQLATLTLLIFGILGKRQPKLGKLYWTITAFEIILVLGHGMKEEIISNLIPYAIFLILGYKSDILKFDTRFIMRLSFLTVFVLYGVFPYVSIFRSISIKRHIDWSEISVMEVMEEYGDYILKKGNYADISDEDFNKNSTGYALSRAGSIGCNSWLINRTFEQGVNTKFFEYCLAGIIPRALWPDKPPVIVGNMMYELALGHDDWDVRAQRNSENKLKVTSLAPGFVGASYMSFGLIGAIFTFIIPGIVIGWLWFFIKDKLSYNLIAIWLFYSIIRVILKDFEAFKDAGLTFYI